MTCPECDQVMHMDSLGVCSCVACGYRESQNPEIDVEEPTNDAGESTKVDVEETLKQRGDRYGSFDTHSRISKELRGVIFSHLAVQGKLQTITPYMEEAVVLICHKLARIVNGDPFYDDNWHDIAGYATLVKQQLQKEKDE
jgi:DNA-directed RNA polymerase subunit M/transcription elongation factor TFIIS